MPMVLMGLWGGVVGYIMDSYGFSSFAIVTVVGLTVVAANAAAMR